MAYGPVSIGGYASLAPASDTQLGGIKTSDDFSISPDGVLKLSDEISDLITPDKTLSVVGKPAEAAETGKRLLSKLDLSGGTMTGALNFHGGQDCSIFLGEQDAANGPGDPLNNFVIRSWWGVSFTTNCPDQTYTGKTAVGIDCRNGTVKASRFEGVADNGVVASGAGYVRFGDGTQICWGTPQGTVTFPVAFATTSYCVGMSNARAGSGFGQSVIPYITKRTATDMIISSADYGDSYIAIGRWK